MFAQLEFYIEIETNASGSGKAGRLQAHQVIRSIPKGFRIDIVYPLLQHRYVVRDNVEADSFDWEIVGQEPSEIVSHRNLPQLPVATVVYDWLHQTFRAYYFPEGLNRENNYIIRNVNRRFICTSVLHAFANHTRVTAFKCHLVQAVPHGVEVRTGQHLVAKLEVDQE